MKRRARRIAAAAAAIAALGAVGTWVLVTATVASAHHADITASAACTGEVTFTVTDWATAGPGAANSDIRVEYNTGGGWVTVTDGSVDGPHPIFAGRFTPTPDIPGTVVAVRATAEGMWGDGAGPGDMRSTSTTIPGHCDTTTTTGSATTTSSPPSTTTTTSTTAGPPTTPTTLTVATEPPTTLPPPNPPVTAPPPTRRGATTTQATEPAGSPS